ncbi:MAG: GxxExxY protein [Bacteroidetes bacterium]|nr:MAG: GxxExxY protein [Bacteroidota bacterium]
MKITQKLVNEIAYEIVGCAIEVHKQMGPGLMESVYELCMIEELQDRGLGVASQVKIPLLYKGKPLDKWHVLDLLVNDLIIVELKAVEQIIPLFKAQLLSYLNLAQKPKGLLINFQCMNISKQVVPLVSSAFAQLPPD